MVFTSGGGGVRVGIGTRRIHAQIVHKQFKCEESKESGTFSSYVSVTYGRKRATCAFDLIHGVELKSWEMEHRKCTHGTPTDSTRMKKAKRITLSHSSVVQRIA